MLSCLGQTDMCLGTWHHGKGGNVSRMGLRAQGEDTIWLRPEPVKAPRSLCARSEKMLTPTKSCGRRETGKSLLPLPAPGIGAASPAGGEQEAKR